MIYILFSTTDNLFSKVIKFMTWSRFSHVEWVTERGTVFGADALNGVCEVGLSERIKRASCLSLHALTMDEMQEQSFINFMEAQRGKPYDWSGIFGGALRRQWASPDKWFCSELVAAACASAGRPLLRIQENQYNRVTPQDVYHSPLFLNVSENMEEVIQLIASRVYVKSRVGRRADDEGKEIHPTS